MADRSVKVSLVLQAQGYMAGVENVSRKTRELGSETEKLAQKKESFQTLGTAALGVGAAVSAVGVAVAKTGIEYNTLQQTSRAALATLLGGAEAANQQMDKLDEFARTSPFSKSVFIDAQQQLLGFGMEAERVVPTLDAIQNAVAATGGSNEDIAELTRIIAQLEGGVKISAETFNQFGTRGIDAAQLIGDAMGKTGQQIRDEVTAGTLDADTAIQALTDGMSARFSGAADNVKNTFDGAMDRVKAAWRDVAAELMEPLVDPNGGGFLIDAANGVADLMRAFQQLPDSVKGTIGLLSGAAGAALLVGGTALVAVPKIADLKNAMKTLEITTTASSKAVLGLKAAAGALVLAGAISAVMEWGDAANLSADNSDRLRKEIEGVADAADVLTVALKGTQEADAEGIFARSETSWKAAKTELEDLAGLMDDARKFNTSNLWENLTDFRLSAGSQAAYDTLKNIGTELSGLAEQDLPSAQRGFRELGEGLSEVQLSQLLRELPDYREELSRVAEENGIAANQGNLLAIATGDVSHASDDAKGAIEGLNNASEESEGAAEAAADALGMMQGKAEETSGAVEDLADQIRSFGSAELDVRSANRDFEEALDDLAEAVEKNGTTLDITTEAGRENEAALDAIAEKAKDVAAAVYEQTGSEEAAAEALARGRDQLIKNADQFDITGQAAEDYADKLGLAPEYIDTLARLSTEDAEAQLGRFLSGRSMIVDVLLEPQGLGTNPGDPGWGVLKRDNAMGNLYMGGKPKEFAAGGFASGIYPYTAGGIHKFAEEHDEAYISLDPARRGRSTDIWAETGRQLGVWQPSEGPIGTPGRAASAKPSVNVTQNIYTQPGMSEADVGRIAARRVADALGG